MPTRRADWEYQPAAISDDGRWTVWFFNPGTRSWTRFNYQPDTRRWPVHQFGLRRLFDEVTRRLRAVEPRRTIDPPPEGLTIGRHQHRRQPKRAVTMHTGALL